MLMRWQAGEAVRADEGVPLRPIRRATATAEQPFTLHNPGPGRMIQVMTVTQSTG